MDELASTVAHLTTTAGIILGGVFAYIKFFGARTLKTRLTTDLEVELQPDPTKLLVTWSIMNVGFGAVRIPKSATSAIVVDGIDAFVWDDAMSAADGSVLWSKGHQTRVPILLDNLNGNLGEDSELLEPGCRLTGSNLIPMPPDMVAYRTTLVVAYRVNRDSEAPITNVRIACPLENPENRQNL